MTFEAVRRRIDRAAARSGRDPGDITLVVVSKGRTEAEITSVYQQGHRDFGENRAAALAEKAGRLPRDITWHFVGPLQTNKVRMVRPVADLASTRSIGSGWPLPGSRGRAGRPRY